MNEKQLYESPEMEVITFEEEDVITTSGGLGENELPTVPFQLK